MLAVRLIAAALLAACAGLVGPAGAEPQTPEFREVWRAAPDAWIDFIHVETEHPELVLGVYSQREQLTTWTERGPLPRTIQLDGDQRFVASINRRLVAIVGYPFDCFKPDIVHGRTLHTELIFPKGFPPPPPEPPVPDPPAPPPPPGPPPPIAGTYQVHLSDSAELLVYTQAGLEDHMPAQVVVFGRTTGSPSRFVRVGSYTNQGQGEVQTSRVGRRIAQVEGSMIRILDERGTVGSRVPGGAGFRLAPSGDLLAVFGRRSVFLYELDAVGRVVAQRRVDVTSRPLDVCLAADKALIRSRERLTLVEVATGTRVWEKESGVGTYASAHMAVLASGELLIAAGRREVLQAPARLDGAHGTGRARAHVDLLSSAGQPLQPAFRFATARWTRHSPQVQVLPSARRVLVHTRDQAYVTDRLP